MTDLWPPQAHNWPPGSKCYACGDAFAIEMEFDAHNNPLHLCLNCQAKVVAPKTQESLKEAVNE